MVIRRKSAFTIVELIVVISIIDVLAIMVLLGLRAIRYRALDVQRRGDLASLNRALEDYTGDNNEQYPDSKKDASGNNGLECLNYDKNDLINYNKTSPTGKLLVENGHLNSIPKPKGGGCYYYLHSSKNSNYLLYVKSSDGKAEIVTDSGNQIYSPPANPVDPDDPFYLATPRRFDGESAFSSFGESLASLGDQNDDGFDEIIIGSPDNDLPGKPGAGSVYIYSSKTGQLLKKFDGPSSSAAFGSSVSNLGDQNGDGKEEIVVGAFGAGGSGSGAVYIYTLNDSNPIKTFYGQGPNNFFGRSVSRIGDISGDGKDDIIVGATRNAAAYVFSISNPSYIRKYPGAIGFGSVVKNISDQDGDKQEDILVSSPQENDGPKTGAGAVYIFSSKNDTSPSIKILRGINANENFGSSVAVINDQDHDNQDEIAASAKQSGSAHANVRVFYSNTSYNNFTTLESDNPSGWFGSAISRLGDQNNDGKDELVITEPNINRVQIFTYNGSSWANEAINTPTGSASFGNSVYPIKDTNYNGLDELIIGDNGFNINPDQHDGAAYLYPIQH